MEDLTGSVNIRKMAKNHNVSTGTIANRLERLSHQVIIQNKIHKKDLILNEDLVADGFESFTVSQYFPENINLLVGKNSQYVYAFNHVTIRRKGRMTVFQKKKREFLDTRFPFRKNGIFESFRDLLKSMLEIWKPNNNVSLTLYTDEKKEYGRAVLSFRELTDKMIFGQFHHSLTNSRIRRDMENNLFPVNYMDREIRKDLAAYRRETVCFPRNVAAAMGRLSIYFYYHNYLKPYRIMNKVDGKVTHAFMANIKDSGNSTKKRGTLFVFRFFVSHHELDEFESNIWFKRLPTPLKKGKEYIPAYYGG
jgi:hypothetical protein